MDEQSGETEEEEVIGEVVGESKMEELVPEWGLLFYLLYLFFSCLLPINLVNKVDYKGSWFQRHGES